MNKKLFSTLSAASLLAGSLFANDGAATDAKEFYGAIRGGMNFGSKFGLNDYADNFGPAGALTSSGTTSMQRVTRKAGFDGGIAMGYTMDEWNFELALDYRKNNLKSGQFTYTGNAITVAGAAANSFTAPITSGSQSFLAVMLNAYYNFHLHSDWSWYVGAGLGYARTRAELNYGTSNGGALAIGGNALNIAAGSVGSWANTFAWQLMTGPRWHFHKHADLSVGYRLFSTTQPKYKIKGFGNFDGKVKTNTPMVHVVEAAVRFHF
jgi:opacity protein-like surface antigen